MQTVNISPAVQAKEHQALEAWLRTRILLQAQAIEDVEALERLALVGEIQAAIGEHAVDVEEGDLDVLGREQPLGREAEPRGHGVR